MGKNKNKKKQPLPIPVFSIADTEEEDYPCVAFLNASPGDMKKACMVCPGDMKKACEEEEEEDIPVIDSRDATQMEEDSSTKKGMSEGNIISIQDSDMGKEDWEIYADRDSFWEDGQRLMDSWYGIEKVPDDGFDDICLQGLSNIENNYSKGVTDGDANVALAMSEIPNDGEDDLCLQGLLDIENNDLIQCLRNISVNFDNGGGGDDIDVDDDFNDDDDKFNKVIADYQY